MSRNSVGSRVRIELAKARLRDGWAPAVGSEAETVVSKPRKAAAAVASQVKTLSQEVTRRDLILTGLAAGVSGLAVAARQGPEPRQVPSPQLFESPRDFARVEDFPVIDPEPIEPIEMAGPPLPTKKPVQAIPRGPLLTERSLALVNENTGESVNAVYWAEGDYVLEGLEEIQVLLRDHHTDEMHAIDLKLVDSLYRLSKSLESQRPLHVLSAYRSPRTNKRLALRYDGVAENSFHMKGKAVDIYIPGRRKRDLARAALSLRVGGVGVYSSFVHVDTGPIRRWDS